MIGDVIDYRIGQILGPEEFQARRQELIAAHYHLDSSGHPYELACPVCGSKNLAFLSYLLICSYQEFLLCLACFSACEQLPVLESEDK